ncbi:hypothetical protein Entas_4120 [Enterobacter soli]|uniref:hypothetical protein n=1 Tax=Enterobacter soli TaxID=885040 RepID=UPI000223D149|nr:hypothetical protein [Enterobacter soli]AEN66825.1 hypothetical protein Entas_4120 [Enterobacter soli]OAT42395.1 hypothetical protein M987_00820 [Enterobacter soli ATCC BAA-2102]
MNDIQKINGKYIYKEPVSIEFDEIILSIIIHVSFDGGAVELEFDPLGMVNQGEGWRWVSEKMSGDQIRKFIIDFVGVDILEITVFPSYEKYWCDITPSEKATQQSILFDSKLKGGEILFPPLPKNIKWKTWPGKYTDYTI